MNITKEDLERELITTDKQSVITQCTKLLQSNKMLTVKLTEVKMQNGVLKKQLEEAGKIRSMNVWQFINMKLEAKIEAIRKRRAINEN